MAIVAVWFQWLTTTPGAPHYVLEFFLLGDTEFAPGYREGSWHSLKVGDTAEHVTATLGPPLRRDRFSDDSREFWRYSRSPGDTHYVQRWLTFDDEGRVVKIGTEFYFD